MAKLKIKSRENWLTVLFFQLFVIVNNVFGHNESFMPVTKVVTLLFFCVVLVRILVKGRLRYNHILLLPIGFTLYCAASILWANVPDVAMNQMITQVQLLLLLLCAFWAMDDGVTILDYVKAVYISGFGMIIFMVINNGGLASYIELMMDGIRMGEDYANTYGMAFANSAVCASYYMIQLGRKKHFISVALFAVFAFSTASRKAILMIFIGVIAMAVLHFGWRRIYKTLLIIAGALVLVTLVLQMPYFVQINKRFTEMLAGDMDDSSKERSDMIRFGLQLFRERPVFGYGIANFATMYFLGVYSHNNYVELLVSGGVIGLVLYYLMLLLPSVGLLLNRKKGQKLDAVHLVLWIMLLLELVCGFALVQLYRKHSWLLMGMLMGEAARVARNKSVLQEDGHEAA